MLAFGISYSAHDVELGKAGLMSSWWLGSHVQHLCLRSYMMWALADHHARDHWWLKQNYDPERRAGHYLLSSYRRA